MRPCYCNIVTLVYRSGPQDSTTNLLEKGLFGFRDGHDAAVWVHVTRCHGNSTILTTVVLSTLYYITNNLQQPCDVVNNASPAVSPLLGLGYWAVVPTSSRSDKRLHAVSDSETYPSSLRPRTALQSMFLSWLLFPSPLPFFDRFRRFTSQPLAEHLVFKNDPCHAHGRNVRQISGG